MHSRLVLLLLLLCLFALSVLLPMEAQAQPAYLVQDLNTTSLNGTGQDLLAAEFIELGSHVLFTASDGIHGFEIWVTDGTEGGTHLLKDLCPGVCSSRPGLLTVAGPRVFFVADDGIHGSELWLTDGTAEGTRMVADLTPGLPSSPLSFLSEFGGSVLFVTADPLHGTELWKSDGTEEGTGLLADIRPGSDSSNPVPWTVMGASFFFLADDGVHGWELWKTDGTGAGTALVKDIRPGSDSAFQAPPSFASTPGATPVQIPRPGAYPFAIASGKLFFTATNANANGMDMLGLWVSDGTETGTALIKELHSFASSPFPSASFCMAGGKLFFSAYGPLWMSDGTEAGTILLRYFGYNPPGAGARYLTPVGNEVFFLAADPGDLFRPSHGIELWKTDGTPTGTSMVKDIWPESGSGAFSYLYTLTALGDRLLFWADDGNYGFEPWISDGTEAGTSLLADLFPGWSTSLSSTNNSDRWVVAGGRLYFRAIDTSLYGMDIWTTDGTPAGTRILKRINPFSSVFAPRHQGVLPGPRPMADLNGELIFQSADGNLWKTNGTAAATAPLASIHPGPWYTAPREFTPLGNLLIFQWRHISDAWAWSTDGTPAGTRSLSTGPVFGPVVEPVGFTLFGSETFFIGQGPRSGLWKTDGTQAGTVFVSSGNPQALTPLGSILLFRDFGPDQEAIELMKNDGDGESVLVKDIQPGGSSSPHQFTIAGNVVLFSADDGSAGRELWKSDGTEAGTVLVEDIRPGADSSLRRSYDGRDLPDEIWAAVGGTVFFPADDGVSGEELWKSDGTEAGTALVKDIFPGSRASDIRWLTAAGGRVFFVADDGTHGRELWVSDGTSAGTRIVQDLFPGAGSSLPQQLAALDHVLLFSATDGVQGRELWRSNGVPAGTRQVQDIAPGPLPSSPMAFTPSGSNVYFAANDGVTGFELWAVPKSNVLATFGDVPTTYWAWRYVEAIAAAGLTRGCAAGQYCPALRATRAEIAAFLVRALHGADFEPPPATGTRFQDVPTSHWAAAWIEQLAADGITKGCRAEPPLFCPNAQVTRAEMAPFLLRLLHGADYMPPPVAASRFADVPADHWAIAWIEQLAAEGITNGCAAGLYCPGALVGRDEIAAFLAKALHLPLP